MQRSVLRLGYKNKIPWYKPYFQYSDEKTGKIPVNIDPKSMDKTGELFEYRSDEDPRLIF